MTSKEALEYIKNDKKPVWDVSTAIVYASDYYSKQLEIIERDLEVLHLIKKIYKINGFDELIPNYAVEEYDDIEKIMEWLEDGN